MSMSPTVDDERFISMSTREWSIWCNSFASPTAPKHASLISTPGPVGSQALVDVLELAANQPCSIGTVAASVRSLSLLPGAAVDERTARNLPELERVRIEARRTHDLSWFAPRLRTVSFRDRSTSGHAHLAHSHVRNVRIEWSQMVLEHLPLTVERLIINAGAALNVRALGPVWQLPRLARLSLSGFAVLGDLRAAGSAKCLTDLSAQAASLEGVEDLSALRSLRLIVAVPHLKPLILTHGLEALELRAREAPADLESVAQVKSLKRLILDLGDVNNLARLKSFAFVKHMQGLEELVVHGVRLEDQDVGPIGDLRSLRTLDLVGSFGPGVGALKEKYPIARITDVSTAPSSPVEIARIGNRWVIFQDLAAVLGVENNYEAEAALKAELRRMADDRLFEGLEFDSEAGAVCVRGESKQALEQIAAAIERLRRN